MSTPDLISSVSLTSTSYVVLGCLASEGPLTPYELKAVVTAGVGYFWAFPHSQLYSEPARLAEVGLLDEVRETSGRRRRVFSITEDGRTALRAWLGNPSSELPEIRDIALLKLYFGAHTSVRQLRALAGEQLRAHQNRLDEYLAMSGFGGPAAAASTLAFGIAHERAATAFWTSIHENPPKPGR